MKKLLCLALLCLVSGSMLADDKKEEKKDTLSFTTVKENPITSIKNQNRSGTCWCFSTLGFLESELLKAGKGEVDLCEAFVVHHTMTDRAEASVRMHGDVSFSQGGSFYDVLYCLKNYGLAPEDAMPAPGTPQGDSLFNNNELDQVAGSIVNSIAKGKQKTITPLWKKSVEAVYDTYLGRLPETFNYKGKSYTPQSFASMLGLNADDYVSITSFTHHPFYESFVIEAQDNWRWAQSYNVPMDEMMEIIDHAINEGYTIAWGADVSEKGFGRDGLATVPATSKNDDMTGSDAARWTGSNKTNEKTIAAKGEKTITQEMRQKAYDNWETTDDHGMQIYGIAQDQNGAQYYMVKNSWGDYGKYHGMFYASKPYVAYKTMNFVVNKKALPKHIAKKLGL